MSSLGNITDSNALDNIANSFYMFALHVGMLEVDELIVDNLTVLGDLEVDGDSKLNSTTLQGGILTYTPATGHSVPYFNATKALSSQTLTDGQLQIGSTGANPTAASITGTNGITITNGAGSISAGLTSFEGPTVITDCLKFGTFSVGMTGTRNLTYYRIGNLVFWMLDILLSAVGSSTGTATVVFPYIITAQGAAAIPHVNNFQVSSDNVYRNLSLEFTTGATVATIRSTDITIISVAPLVSSIVNNTQFNSTTAMKASGVYIC